MGNRLSWSFSRAHDYETCPYMFWGKTISKIVPFEQSDAMKEGEYVHKVLERRVREGVPIPMRYPHLESIAKTILEMAKHGEVITETKYALNDKLQPTGYFADDCWLRVVTDVGVLSPETAWLGDYKNGKRKPGSWQLKLNAATAFQVYPSLKTVATSYIWTQSGGKIDTETYTRDELPSIWAELLVTPAKMQASYDANSWPKTPSEAVCKFCDLNKAGKCDSAAAPPWKAKS